MTDDRSHETFAHPAAIRRDYVKYTGLRLLLWALIGIPFWIFGILMALRGDGYVGIGFAAAFTLIKTGFEIFFYIGSREILALADCRIVLEGGRLRQVDPDGKTVASIDLAQPFTVDFTFNLLGQPIYRVAQEDRTLGFAARLDGAERLVKEVLGAPAKWPPEVPQPESAAQRYHRRAERDND